MFSPMREERTYKKQHDIIARACWIKRNVHDILNELSNILLFTCYSLLSTVFSVFIIYAGTEQLWLLLINISPGQPEDEYS